MKKRVLLHTHIASHVVVRLHNSACVCFIVFNYSTQVHQDIDAAVERRPEVYEPDSILRMSWDLVKSIFSLYYLIIIPLRIAFAGPSM